MDCSFDCTFEKSLQLPHSGSVKHYIGRVIFLQSVRAHLGEWLQARKHFRLLLSYLGAQWTFKARPSLQFALKTQIFSDP